MATMAKSDCHQRLHQNLAKPRHVHDPRMPKPIPTDPNMESVYALIPEEYIPPPKEKIYRSKYADKARREYTDTQKTASMGPPKVLVPPTNQFLRKGAGVPKVAVPKTERTKAVRKAPLPTEPTKLIPPPTKDYIKQNALDNINSLPKRVNHPQPRFLAKKDYGAVPDYLKTRIQQIKEEELARAKRLALEKEQQDNTALEQQGIVVLPDEERERILKGLRENWERLNNEYQRLSLTVDTVPKIARKVNMEQQLKQYEDLIDRFTNTTIHVNFGTHQ